MAERANTYDVVLLHSFAQVEDWRKRHAGMGEGGLFGQVVTTFPAWVADLWELHGDGRSLVDPLQRQVIMQAVFERAEGEAGGERALEGGAGNGTRPEGREEGSSGVSPGTVELASKIVQSAAGVPVFEDAVEAVRIGSVPSGLASREADLLGAVADYYGKLDSAGMIELGHAMAYLAQSSERVFPRKLRVLLAREEPLDWQERCFFDACDQLNLEVAVPQGASGISRMPEGVRLRFGFPSGRYAQPALVLDLAREAAAARKGVASAEDGAFSFVVACKDPLALYDQVEGELLRLGAHCCLQAQVPFASTDFGRQFLSLAGVMQDYWSKEGLSDAVRPPFSGFDEHTALEIDKELRKDRLAQRDGCLAGLRSMSDTFSQLEELALDPDADILIGVFEQIAFTACRRTDAWRAEQLSALSALRMCTRAARSAGADMQACARVLRHARVSVSFEARRRTEQPGLDVVVTTQEAAARMGAGSCQALVLCDLTSDDYPASERDDASDTLFGKLGLHPVDSALAQARRRFKALQNLPTSELACLRPLNDWDGNPTYPAPMLQEFVDAYRCDASSDDDLDEVYGLPPSLREGLVQRGEERLYANAAALPREAKQEPACETIPAGAGTLAQGERDKVALARRSCSEGAVDGFSPSPSQVEMFLECPYKWFVQRRLDIEGLDEGFGALERGSFVHAVLQEFYWRFMESGQAKVNASNIGQARELMRLVADELEREQRSMPPGSGRYVAATQIEQRELEACKDQLVRFLDFEMDFLPGFHPAHLEYEIRLEDGLRYAGHPFVGTVDRIDVDDAGNAVIIDYKGSVGVAHEIAGKAQAAPGKVQTRMYAQVVSRALGVRVVGALYVGYGKARACSGAYDGRVIDSAHLPGMKHDRCRCAVESPRGEGLAAAEAQDFSLLTFPDMLDCTERLVERAIGRMEQGDVEPNPATSDACEYCPVAYCPKRGA